MSEDYVVDKVCGVEVTQNQLSKIFDKVKNKENWKYPIDATIKMSLDEQVILEYAIIHFTGSVPVFTVKKGTKIPRDNTLAYEFRVRADGYYIAVGA